MSEQIEIVSVVSHRDGQPYVHLRWGRERGQLTPAEATKHAMKVIEAAQASITDSFLFAFMKERIEADDAAAGRVLQDFRGYRKALEERGHA